MKKHKTINSLIVELNKDIDLATIQVIDFWDADLCAIGLKKNDRLIYISTYNYSDSNEMKFDCDLELIHELASGKMNLVKSVRSISYAELLIEINSHL